MSVPPDGMARGSLPRRRAAEIVRAHHRREAAREAGIAVAGLSVAVALWWWADPMVSPMLLLLVGLVLLWAGSQLQVWWQVAHADPRAEPSPTAVRDAALARAAVGEAHQRRLAAGTPYLTHALVGAVALVTVLQLVPGGERSVALAGLVKPLARRGEWWRLLTAGYLHGGLWHVMANLGALRSVGPVVEAYVPRWRLPLVFLVAVLAGSGASLLAYPDVPSVGASGGIMGLVAYLLVLTWRRPHDPVAILRGPLLQTIVFTAYVGAFGFAFIDNAAHAGGALAGALVALGTAPRARADVRPAVARLLDLLGLLAALGLAGGAAFAALRLLGRA